MESLHPRIDGTPPAGLALLTEFVTTEEHDRIAEWFDANGTWGFRNLGNPVENFLEGHHRCSFPPWSEGLIQKMLARGIFTDGAPNAIHAIYYDVGKGIGRHRDRAEFGETVAVLTLRSSRVLELVHRTQRQKVANILLCPGDLYVLQGEARWEWVHGIPSRVCDHFHGQVYERTEGMSVSFRRKVLEYVSPPLST